MMTKLREMSKLFLYLLVVAFLALMVLEWGADITGRSSQGNNIVGKINGHEITVEEYNQMLQNAYENERQRTGGELSDADMKRLQNEVWENIIQQILLQEQIKKMGIKRCLHAPEYAGQSGICRRSAVQVFVQGSGSE